MVAVVAVIAADEGEKPAIAVVGKAMLRARQSAELEDAASEVGGPVLVVAVVRNGVTGAGHDGSRWRSELSRRDRLGNFEQFTLRRRADFPLNSRSPVLPRHVIWSGPALLQVLCRAQEG